MQVRAYAQFQLAADHIKQLDSRMLVEAELFRRQGFKFRIECVQFSFAGLEVEAFEVVGSIALDPALSGT